MHHGNQAAAGGLLMKYNRRTQSYTFNQLLTWGRSFNFHNIDLLVGHEFYAYKYEFLSAGKTNLVDGILELRPGTNLYNADSYSEDYRVESFFGRFNYNFNEKYYFSASIRTDGSSRFQKDNRWGTFWSVGANWRISQEKFMQNLTWISNLSAKISYGEQGNDNLLRYDSLEGGYVPDYYPWQGLYPLEYPNANQVGGLIGALENKKLSWEKSGNLNVGIEASMFDGRLNVSAEYYNRKTTDMLLGYPKATSSGFSEYNANIGSMRNTGFEFSLGGSLIKTTDFIWNLTWMGSTVTNKVLKLTGESPEIIKEFSVLKRECLLIHIIWLNLPVWILQQERNSIGYMIRMIMATSLTNISAVTIKKLRTANIIPAAVYLIYMVVSIPISLTRISICQYWVHIL